MHECIASEQHFKVYKNQHRKGNDVLTLCSQQTHTHKKYYFRSHVRIEIYPTASKRATTKKKLWINTVCWFCLNSAVCFLHRVSGILHVPCAIAWKGSTYQRAQHKYPEHKHKLKGILTEMDTTEEEHNKKKKRGCAHIQSAIFMLLMFLLRVAQFRCCSQFKFVLRISKFRIESRQMLDRYDSSTNLE